MYEAPSPPTEAALHHATELCVVLHADMLEHAHRHESVVLSADVAVVVLDVLDLPGESFARGPFASPHDRLVRDVESTSPYAEAARHVHGQHAPAAARLDHALAGPEAQLAAHMIHFRHLRPLERRGRRP